VCAWKGWRKKYKMMTIYVEHLRHLEQRRHLEQHRHLENAPTGFL
jgi:hypothetical protein